MMPCEHCPSDDQREVHANCMTCGWKSCLDCIPHDCKDWNASQARLDAEPRPAGQPDSLRTDQEKIKSTSLEILNILKEKTVANEISIAEAYLGAQYAVYCFETGSSFAVKVISAVCQQRFGDSSEVASPQEAQELERSYNWKKA